MQLLVETIEKILLLWYKYKCIILEKIITIKVIPWERENIKMKNIKDYDLQDLKDEHVSIGEKGFRAEQIFKWIYQEKVKSFDEMTNNL